MTCQVLQRGQWTTWNICLGKRTQILGLSRFCHHVEKADFLELGPHFSQQLDPGGETLQPSTPLGAKVTMFSLGLRKAQPVSVLLSTLLSQAGVVVGKNFRHSLRVHCMAKAHKRHFR